jgi:hypothetical protein
MATIRNHRNQPSGTGRGSVLGSPRITGQLFATQVSWVPEVRN